MGVDIHLHIIKNKTLIAKEIFTGRNSEWFNNLQGKWGDKIYDELPRKWYLVDETPDPLIKESKEDFLYGHSSIKVSDYKEWFSQYRPDLDAGWVTTYEKWLYETKHIIPEELLHYLDSDANIHDMHFIRVTNPYDCSGWLYQYLIDNKVDDDAWLIYWFDC